MTLPHAVAAQGVQPGDPSLNTGRITPGSSIASLFVLRDGERRVVSTVTRTVARAEIGGRSAFLYVQSYARPDGSVSVDSSWVDATSLAPLSYRAALGTEDQTFTFDPEFIRGRVVPRDSAARDIEVPLSAPVFNAVPDDLIIAALPLRAGYETSWEAYNPPRGTSTVRIAVTGDEGDTWVVAYDAGAAPTTMWVHKTTGRIMRQRSMLQGGAEFWVVPVE